MRLKTRIEDSLFNLKMWWQRKTRGYSDIELWNLDDALAEWVLPRLKAFRKQNDYAHPADLNSIEEWHSIIDEMIYGIEFMQKSSEVWRELVGSKEGAERDAGREKFKEEVARAENGRELFGKWMAALWW